MVEFITKLFFEMFTEFILGLPGAFVRYLFYWRTKSYKELLQDTHINSTVGGFSIATVIGLIFIFKHY